MNFREQYYLVDAGEGAAAARALRHQPLKLRAVFISHLHGDHVYGLFPLLSTLGLYGRRTPLPIYAPAPFGDAGGAPALFDSDLPYEPVWHEVRTTEHALLFENRTLEVWSVPLRHRDPPPDSSSARRRPPSMPTKEAIARYGLSIAQITAAKRGEDLVLDTGEVLPTTPCLPAPCAPRLRLPLGHEPLGQGRGAVRRRRSDVPRGDLRRGRKPPRPRAGALDHARRGESGPSRPVRDAC